MKKWLQVLALAAVAAAFVTVPTRDAKAITIAGWLTGRGYTQVIPAINNKFATKINFLTSLNNPTATAAATQLAGVQNWLNNFLNTWEIPGTPPTPPPTTVR